MFDKNFTTIIASLLLVKGVISQAIDGNEDAISNEQHSYSDRIVWMVLAIVFISLFGVSLLVNITMIFVKRRNLTPKHDVDVMKRPSQTNVFYGGTKL